MTGFFGILALILAAVGLYGVTAYTVERRNSEIGVRMTLGANRTKIVRLVLLGKFLQILVGLVVGIPISILTSHLIAHQLYQVKAWDPLVLSAAYPQSNVEATSVPFVVCVSNGQAGQGTQRAEKPRPYSTPRSSESACLLLSLGRIGMALFWDIRIERRLIICHI